MKQLFSLSLLCMSLFGTANAQFSFGKIDTTVKIGKAGYRVDCKNKNVDQNQLMIKPIGFDREARDMNFMIRGRVSKVEIEDPNADGFPDLIITIYSDSVSLFGTVYAFLSEGNKTITPCVLPDIMMNGKVNAGYKGHDQFAIMTSYLQQKFPIYKSGDDKDKPTGGTRVLLYQLGKNPEGKMAFNLTRTYDTQ
ncbi:hypothetical protein ACX0G9_10025 [Flavitalea flava]